MSLAGSRILPWVLVFSVAMNLLLIGGIAGRVMSRVDAPPLPPNLGWIVRDLDANTQRELQPQLEQYGESVRPLRVQMFRAQRQVNELIAAEPLDRPAIQRAFADLRRANIAYQEATHEQTIRVFQLLTEKQRKNALEFMNERRNPGDPRPALRRIDQ